MTRKYLVGSALAIGLLSATGVSAQTTPTLTTLYSFSYGLGDGVEPRLAWSAMHLERFMALLRLAGPTMLGLCTNSRHLRYPGARGPKPYCTI
jgi:hypothetical protein